MSSTIAAISAAALASQYQTPSDVPVPANDIGAPEPRPSRDPFKYGRDADADQDRRQTRFVVAA